MITLITNSITDLLHTYGLLSLVLIALISFIAGFIDAVVGGGGLITVPYLLIAFPKMPLPILFGTNKIAALCGTSISAIKYSQKIKFDLKLLVLISLAAFSSSYIGAQAISLIDTAVLKPLILVILILIAIYTFIKKDLGTHQTKTLSATKQMLFGSCFGFIIGFYDGFFGPGTGSFFVLAFVVVLGFEFVTASAYAKVVNCITNISALIVFIKKGFYILPLAITMALFNIAGSYMGSHLALKKGNGFVRIFFLLIVTVMIIKYGYDVLGDL